MKNLVPSERKENKLDYRVPAHMVDESHAQALAVDVYRNNNGQCSNNGVSHRYDQLLVIGVEGTEVVNLNNPPENAVWLLAKPQGTLEAPFYCVAPLDSVNCGGKKYYANGGNVCATSDSRWGVRYALPVLDRDESKYYNASFKKYEMMCIIKPDEKAAEEAFQELIKEIKYCHADVKKEERWGKKRLAYEMDGYDDGYYFLVTFDGTQEMCKKIDKYFRHTDAILRMMIIRKGE